MNYLALKEQEMENGTCCVAERKVTEECVKDFIINTDIVKMGKKTCVVVATLKNGYEIVGHSACVDPDNYDEVIGVDIAMKMVENKVWELLGFQLQNDLLLNDALNEKQERKEGTCI